MNLDRIFQRDHLSHVVTSGLLILALLLTFLMSAPAHLWAQLVLVENEIGQESPLPSESPMRPSEFDIRKPPIFIPNSQNFSMGPQEELGVFLDKGRQAFGFQWEPEGSIPGIDLGLESHNLHSLNRVFPGTGAYPNWTPQSDAQYFGLSPTAPDHSGAFLRFRW